MENALKIFQENKTGQYGNLYIYKNAIKYININSDNLRLDNDHVLLFRTRENKIFANSSSLTGRKNFRSRNKLENFEVIQRQFCEKFSAIPFQVFKELGKNINDLKVLFQGPQENFIFKKQREKYCNTKKEYITEKYDENFHFIGACLIFDGENTHLIDLDRIEIENQIVNIFMATLSGKIDNVKNFYNALKPEVVKKYENEGHKIKRQGEWFFIPMENVILKPGDQIYRFSFSIGNSTPNIASHGFIDGQNIYVTGKIKHQNNEHKEIDLGNMVFMAVPNTSKANLKLTGQVD